MPRLTPDAPNPNLPESHSVVAGSPAGAGDGPAPQPRRGGGRRSAGAGGSRRGRRVLALGISVCAAIGLLALELEQVQAASPDVIAALADELAEPHAADAGVDARARLGAMVRRATDAVPGDVTPPPAARTWSHDTVTVGLGAIAAFLGPVMARSLETKWGSTSPGDSLEPPTVDLVTVPDVDGLTIAEAHRQLRAAGVRVSVRDELGNGVMRDEWRDLEVFRQSVATGRKIARGSWVHITASYGSRRLVQGY